MQLVRRDDCTTFQSDVDLATSNAGDRIIGMIMIQYFGERLIASLLLPIFELAARVAGRLNKKIDVGMGTNPRISNIYLKKGLSFFGYSSETFVFGGSHITDEFDFVAQNLYPKFSHKTQALLLFFHCIFTYKIVYLPFVGGPLSAWPVLRRFEPRWFSLARIYTVILPYGSDIQEMTRNPNLLFRHGNAMDYSNTRRIRPEIARRIDLWNRKADFVLAGLDWVEYLIGWDLLVSSHISIDTEIWIPQPKKSESNTSKDVFRVLHAPNHRNIKGTQFIIDAIRDLQEEGLPIELTLLENVPNTEIHKAILASDVIVDQLVMGWYANFALEGMACEKPVICYLDDRYLELHRFANTFEGEVPPMINARFDTIKDALRQTWENRNSLPEIGKKSRDFVEKFHSTQAIGAMFDQINRSFGVIPSQK